MRMLVDTGDKRGALKLLRRVVEKRREELGRDSSHTIDARMLLQDVLFRMRVEKGVLEGGVLELLAEMAESGSEIFGKEDITTALGQKRPDEARAYFLEEGVSGEGKQVDEFAKWVRECTNQTGPLQMSPRGSCFVERGCYSRMREGWRICSRVNRKRRTQGVSPLRESVSVFSCDGWRENMK